MTNNNMKSVKAIFSQPTTNEGGLKKSVWTTKGLELVTANPVVDTENGISINGVEIAKHTLYAKSLQIVADGTESLETWLKYMSRGFISPQQLATSEAGTPVTKVSSPADDLKRIELMTADEREAYLKSLHAPAKPNILDSFRVIKDSIDGGTVADIAEAITEATALLSNLKEYKKALAAPITLTAEELESLTIQRQKEAGLIKLSAAGFVEITRLSSVLYRGKLGLAAVSDGMAALTSAGYTLSGNPVYDAASGVMLVMFKEGETEKLS